MLLKLGGTSSLNEQWRKLATDDLTNALSAKGISTAATGQGTVECTIDVTYGNQALRYFVGFGAGAGHMRVAIALKDSAGVERYRVLSEADLAIGAFGGSMSDVAKDTVEAAVTNFSSKL